jgi:nucleoside-diphosphate-sugar epimerase
MQALDLARERGARRFVYVSSPAAIGPAAGSGRLDESVASNPTTLYGITKRASEQLVGRFAAIHGLSAVSVRIAQPYGPGERPTPSRVRTSPIYEWLAAAERGETLVTGPLTNGRDWTWVEDTARGIALLATDAHPRHDLYHLGVGRIATAGEVVELLRERFPELAVDERPDAPGLNPNIAGQRRPPLGCRRFRDEFGWSPATTIGEGLRRYSASSS